MEIKACNFCEYCSTKGECILKLPRPLTSCYTPMVLKRIDHYKKEKEKEKIIEKKKKGVSNIALMKEYSLNYAQLRTILDTPNKKENE